MKDTASKTLTLKTLNKSNVWDIQENDIFRMVESAQKDADLKDNMRHYLDIIKSAFDIEEVKIDKPEVIKKYEARGFKVAQIKTDDNEKVKWAIKKHPITRVTDLTYENIGHISAAKLIEVLDRNFGGEVLEIQKGSWTEAIFAKEKPKVERQRTKFEVNDEEEDILDDENYDEEEEIVDNYNNDDEDDDFDEDKLTEESYRTTIEEDPDSLSLEAADIVDEEDY